MEKQFFGPVVEKVFLQHKKLGTIKKKKNLIGIKVKIKNVCCLKDTIKKKSKEKTGRKHLTHVYITLKTLLIQANNPAGKKQRKIKQILAKDTQVPKHMKKMLNIFSHQKK